MDIVCSMCKQCVNVAYPKRQTTCLDGGSYILNFKGCFDCKKRDTVKISKCVSNVDNTIENVCYSHLCSLCDHFIAEHTYTFEVDGNYCQYYEMDCLLCGNGQDTVEKFEPKCIGD